MMITGESLGDPFIKFFEGSKKRVIPNVNTWGFRAFFEISMKLTSPSEPASCTCP